MMIGMHNYNPRTKTCLPKISIYATESYSSKSAISGTQFLCPTLILVHAHAF